MNSFRAYKLKLPSSATEELANEKDYLDRLHRNFISVKGDYIQQCNPWLRFGDDKLSNYYDTIAKQDKLMSEDFFKFYANFSRFSSFYPGICFDNACLPLNLSRNTNVQNPFFPRVPPLIYIPPFGNKSNLKPDASNLLRSEKVDTTAGVDLTLQSSNARQQRAKSKTQGTPHIDIRSSKGIAKHCSPKRNGKTSKKKFNAICGKPDPDIFHVECDKNEGCFKCHFCSRKFSYVCHLKVHERVHTGEKPYSCRFCNHQFSQLGSLTVHMRIHTGAKPYQCGECWKKFRHVNSLRRHQRQVHSMTNEQIARSIDKVKNVMLMDSQIAEMERPQENNQGNMNDNSGANDSQIPFDIQSALQFCHVPFPWGDPTGQRDQVLKSGLISGKQESHSDSTEMETEAEDDLDVGLPARSITDKKALRTWRPFEVASDDEDENAPVEGSAPPSRRLSVSPDSNAGFPGHVKFGFVPPEKYARIQPPPPLVLPGVGGPFVVPQTIRNAFGGFQLLGKKRPSENTSKNEMTDRKNSANEASSPCYSPDQRWSPLSL